MREKCGREVREQRAARPLGRAKCGAGAGCSAIKHQSLVLGIEYLGILAERKERGREVGERVAVEELSH